MLYGAIEAGGTKFVCAVGNEKLEIVERVSYPTTTPKQTLELVIQFFNQYEQELSCIAVGSFGPIDINSSSKTFGYITSTPKKHWQFFDFVGTLKQAFHLPVVWTTDVNAAGYGEYTCGHGQGLNSLVYFTIGTGIGGCALMNGQFIEGLSHPEMGHMHVKIHTDDPFEGACPYHKNCLEGMASGPAIEKRTGFKGQNLKSDDPFWDIEANYIAQCAYNVTLLFSPEKIILGGGVFKQPILLEKVKKEFTVLIGNYVKTPNIDNYIITPKLEDNAGIIGCLALAKNNSNVY